MPAASAAMIGTLLLLLSLIAAPHPRPGQDPVPEAAAVWRYTFEDPGEGWAEPGFDDSSWQRGPAPFGAPGTPGIAPATEWRSDRIWLRRWEEVELVDPAVGRFRFFHDEDLRIWWNGVEAVRASGWSSEYLDKLGRPEAMARTVHGPNLLAVTCRNLTGGQGVDVTCTVTGRWVFGLGAVVDSQSVSLIKRDLDGSEPRWADEFGPVGNQPVRSIAQVQESTEELDWLKAHLVDFQPGENEMVARFEVWTEQGSWEIEDYLRATGAPESLGRPHLHGTRRWTWHGDAISPPVVLAIRWRTDHHNAARRPPERSSHFRSLVLPGVLYHGNPAGTAARGAGWPGLVPEWRGEVGDRLLVEEHRLPIPFVAAEWEPWPADPEWWRQGFALHSLPSLVPFSDRDDLWWSMGARAVEEGTELVLMSGPVAMNGQGGKVKSGQGTLSDFAGAFLQVPPGGTVEKNFWLQAYHVEQAGTGFQRALREAIALHGPFPSAGMPVVEDIVHAKLGFAKSRWRGDNPAPGFAMYPHDRDLYVMGWAGQSEAPGYALQVLADRLGEPELRTIAQRTLDALAESPFDAGGFRLALNGRTGEWSRQDPVSQGQAMTAFARGIRVGREQGADTSKWEAFLRRACELHADRFLARAWDESDQPRSTAEAFLIQPLCLGAALFDEQRYLEAARRAGEHYWQRHRSMAEPYWGGTLDARCEDKEGAWAAFEAFLALHEATGDPEWLTAATHAAEVCLTYTYLWDVDLPPGRLRDHALKTRGWTSVSVQNMHLDVFGVVYTPELWRLGQLTDRPELIELAELMFRSCGQMIDAHGSQGEQLQQTNFAQGGDLSDPDRFRGGYVEGWTVFWITAHFLTAAAQFEEMGVLEQLWRKP